MQYVEKIKKLSELEISILSTATSEFEDKGYHLANIDDIAQKLKIGKGTIYRHFGNKQDLFFYCLTYKFIERFKLLAMVDSYECPYEAMNFSLDTSFKSIENMTSFKGNHDLLTQAAIVAKDQEELRDYMFTLIERSVAKVKNIIDRCVEKSGTVGISTGLISEYIVSTLGVFLHIHHGCQGGYSKRSKNISYGEFNSIKRFIFKGIGIEDKEIDRILKISDKKLKTSIKN